MTFLRVKNLDKHQHYKDRRPPWIKLHAEVLEDYSFACLQDASKVHLMLIWVLASRMDNRIPNDPQWIGRKINATDPVDVAALVSGGFLEVCDDAGNVVQVASNRLAPRKQSAMPETETETETEGNGARPRAVPVSVALEPEPDDASPGQAAPAPPNGQRADVERVLEHYAARYPRARPFTEPNRKRVKARLREGYTVQDCCDAIDGNGSVKWNRENGKTDLAYALDPAKIAGHIALADRENVVVVGANGELLPEALDLLGVR